jgi:O-antigen/teichoic acid export membrane protein
MRMAAVLFKGRFSSGFIWNLAGVGVPLAFALYAIPQLLLGYGEVRFGFLTIVWAVIGYFSVFDLGLGRALTRLVAARIAQQGRDIPRLVSTGTLSIAVLGAVFALPLVFTSSFIVTEILKVDGHFAAEFSTALIVMGISLPLVTTASAMIGILEAYGAFALINRVRLVAGLMNFLAPLLALHFTSSLILATTLLAVLRLLSTSVYIFAVKKLVGDFPRFSLWSSGHLNELWRFGSWITVSNLISPLMSQLDRLVVGAVLALAVLPTYSVPGDMVTRLSFIPVAVVGVLFPEFTKAAAQGSGREEEIYRQSSVLMFFGVLPIAAILYCFAEEALGAWISESFASDSHKLLQWLALGFLFNAMARLPHALLQAAGRPDKTAKIHIAELPIYAAGLWWLLHSFGVLGAAMAWTLRMALDLLLMSFVLARIKNTVVQTSLATVAVCAIATGLLWATSQIEVVWARALVVMCLTLTCAAVALLSLRKLEHSGERT